MSGSLPPESTGVPTVLKRPSSSSSTLLSVPFPQILDTLQEKWRAIEREKASWEMEKCQFEVRIIELEAERETEHRIRENLLRRIKMLEYALKDERRKYAQLLVTSQASVEDSSSSTEPPRSPPIASSASPPSLPKTTLPKEADISHVRHSVEEITSRSREILRHYLEQCGISSGEISASSPHTLRLIAEANQLAKKRTIEKIQQEQMVSEEGIPIVTGVEAANAVAPSAVHEPKPSEKDRKGHKDAKSTGEVDEQASPDSHKLHSKKVEKDDPMDMMGESKEPTAEELELMAKQLGVSKGQFMKVSSRSMRPGRRGGRRKVTKRADGGGGKRGGSEDDGDEDDEYEMDEARSKHPKKHGKEHHQHQVETRDDVSSKEGEMSEVIADEQPSESDDTTQGGHNGESHEDMAGTTTAKKVEENQQQKEGGNTTTSENGGGVEKAREKGSGEELAELEDVVVEEPAVQKLNLIGSHKRWNPKFTLRSHFDGIRCIRFDQEEPIVATGSEDGTVKLWNLRYLGKAGSKKSVGTGDIEPYFTLRGHTSGVMAMALSAWEQAQPRFLFSGGLDKSIRVWDFPPSDTDPLGSYGRAVNFLNRTLVGHTDVIWDLDAHPVNTWLLSAAADGSCRMWDVIATDPLKSSFVLQDGKEIPTSARFIPTDLRKILVSYVNGVVVCFDISTGKKIWSCGEEASGPGKVESQINRIAVHPTLNLAVAVREDHRVDVIDIAEGKLVQSLVGHEGSVSSVAMNSSGTYFATSGHDESLRIWDVSTFRCIQEMSVHRPKFDECIHDVAFHPTRTMLGTCGADGTAKVYQ